ncbi:ATP-dependent RNA helicase RhlE [Vibrio stylophorae]|uniref:ATP-dependent RNA helicase RhlE n=1 Tax=Vibrio stylophorae TaxID=659351 RepID=A0ABM8ZSX7_9VIBR|nr:ATP-dependent RNA helicase RhlE [Vibrio stylophorae]
MSFTSLGLSQPLILALNALSYNRPTPIQKRTIPMVIKGEDVIALAPTGSGKTASFVLPLLEKMATQGVIGKKRVRALVLVPSRELALQVEQKAREYSLHLPLKTLAVYGGVDSAPQKQKLIEGIDLLIATPGRLRDLFQQRALHFDAIKYLVLDEADRMLDMGFIDALNWIVDRLPNERQTLLFSATLAAPVRELAKTAMIEPQEVDLRSQGQKPKIEQWMVGVDKDAKSSLLSHLIHSKQWQQALIFIKTKQGAAKLVSQLEKRGIHAEAFHSGRSQAAREQLLEDFKQGKVNFVVATGVVARGIDIAHLERVVNYDLPFPADDYIHRIGRTARAGARGEAISLVSKDDFKNLCMIEKRLGHLLERREIVGFEPKKPVPISILNYVPKRLRDNASAESAAPHEDLPDASAAKHSSDHARQENLSNTRHKEPKARDENASHQPPRRSSRPARSSKPSARKSDKTHRHANNKDTLTSRPSPKGQRKQQDQ